MGSRAQRRSERASVIASSPLVMNHLTAPVERLRDHAASFMRRRVPRLLHVRVDDVLRPAAIDLLEGLQWLPDAHGPVVRVELTTSPAERNAWTQPTAQAQSAHRRLAMAYATSGVALPPPAEPHSGASPLEAFSLALGHLNVCLSATPEPPCGLVVLLVAPEIPARAWADDLHLLIAAPSLVTVRWICVHGSATGAGADLFPHIPPSLLSSVACQVDPSERERELTEMANAVAAAGWDGGGSCRTTAAWPRAEFPPHMTDAKLPRPASDAGGTPLIPIGPDVLGPMMRATREVRNGDFTAAVSCQREARDRCVERGLSSEAVQMDLLLGAYTAQACLAARIDPTPAVEVFSGASGRAQRAGLYLLAAMAELAGGALARVAGAGQVAGRCFMQAARLAATAGSPEIESEALHAASLLAEDAGLEERAAELRARAAAAGLGASGGERQPAAR